MKSQEDGKWRFSQEFYSSWESVGGYEEYHWKTSHYNLNIGPVIFLILPSADVSGQAA